MTTNEKAIQQVEDIVRFIAATPTAVDRSSADGKWDLSDIAYWMPLVMKIPSVVDGFTLTWEGIKKTDSSNAERLIQAVREELEIGNKGHEEAVEQIVEVSFRLAAAINMAIQARKQTQAQLTSGTSA